MRILSTIAKFRAWRRRLPAGALTPFVPTMGALHDGHASLVHAARRIAGPSGAGGSVIASIFVNPTQFGPREDFAKYPRTFNADCVLLEAAGCDALFAPSAEEMYPENAKRKTQDAQLDAASVTVDPGPLGGILEGAIRPGHFRGVCTVVAKLLDVVEPSHLLLGQKDFQQQAILRRMVADLNFPVEVVTCPTLREADGLALSSRNRYLTPTSAGVPWPSSKPSPGPSGPTPAASARPKSSTPAWSNASPPGASSPSTPSPPTPPPSAPSATPTAG